MEKQRICYVCEGAISPDDTNIVVLRPKNENANKAIKRSGMPIYHRPCWDDSWKGCKVDDGSPVIQRPI